MPTVRYEIRNEFGLGGRKLYGAGARKDEPEAILQGVAMAGLVGLLRQLGDLAEFASGIFLDLHKEVMDTATRGHGLMLRVQKVEAEFPLIEKAILCQSSCTQFTYNTGIDWHSNLQMDQNLIIRDGLSKSMMDSYEECRDPPQLSILDKYDAAGAGSCLKRYSNPSFFKTQLVSSGIVESRAERKNRVHRRKEKGPHWRNGEMESPEIFSVAHICAKLQSATSNQDSKEAPLTRVKIKPKNLCWSDTPIYIEHLRQVLAPEENCVSRNSETSSSPKTKTIDSGESIIEVYGDSSGTSGCVQENPSQSPSVNDSDLNQTERENLKVKELPHTPSQYEKSREDCADKSKSSSNNINIGYSDFRKFDEKELSSDDDWRTEGSSSSYRSNEISSDMENYMDAQNTVESEIDTDSEKNVKPKLGFSSMTLRKSSATHDRLELQTQNSRADFEGNSNRNSRTDFDGNSNRASLSSCKSDKADDEAPERLMNYPVEFGSLESLRFRGGCTAKVSPIPGTSELTEKTFNCSVMDSISLLKHSSSNGPPTDAQSTASDFSGMSSIVGMRIGKDSVCLDGDLAHTFAKSPISSPTNNDQLFQGVANSTKNPFRVSSGIASQTISMEKSESKDIFLQNYSQESVLDDICVTFDTSYHPQDGLVHEVPTKLIEGSSSSVNLCTKRSKEHTEHVAQASQVGTDTSVMYYFSCSNGPASMQSRDLHEDSSKLGTLEDELASVRVEVTPDNANLELTSNIQDPQEPHDVSLVRSIPPSSWKGEPCSHRDQPSEFSSTPEDVVRAESETVVSFAESSVHNAVTEADRDHLSLCSVTSAAASCTCSQEENISEPMRADQNDSKAMEKSASRGTNEVCTPCTHLTSLAKGQFSNSELHNPRSSLYSDAKLSNDCFNTIIYQHAKRDLQLNNSEKDCTDLYGTDKDAAPVASPRSHQESRREEMVQSSRLIGEIVEPFAEVPKQAGSIPNLISFERYLSMKQDGNRNNSVTGNIEKQSDSTCRTDSRDTAQGVSFTEFLKLTQMDFLLDITEEASADPPPSENVVRSQASLKISQDVEANLFLLPNNVAERSNSFKEVSELRVSNGRNTLALQHGDESFSPDSPGERVQFTPQTSNTGNFVVSARKLSKSASDWKPFLDVNTGLDLSPSNMPEFGQQLHDRVSSQCSPQLQGSFFPSNSSDMALLMPPDLSVHNPETTLVNPSGQQYGQIYSTSPVAESAFRGTGEKLPPLPPLPPLEWRMGKLQIGYLTSDQKMAHSSIDRKYFTSLSTPESNSAHGLLTEKDTTDQKSNPFVPELEFQEEALQCSSLPFEDSKQPDKCALHSEELKACTSDLSAHQSAVENGNLLYGLQTYNGLHPLNPFISIEDKSSEHSISLPTPLSETEIFQLDQLLSSSSRYCAPNSVKEMETNTSLFFLMSRQENRHLQPQYETPGYLPGEDSSVISDNLSMHMLDDVKPKKKLSLLHRPRDPLIEDVASHDKSTLRRVAEPAQPSSKLKTDESITLLEQIRSKSNNLKPTTSSVKPNLRGPPTNLKVTAILEKANAIRQACMGSDEDDDDGDSWGES